MKCPNCGGEVSVNDLKCPYCGTPNPEGIAFHQEVHKRRRFNQYLKDKTMEQMRLPLAHRILNLSLVILFLIVFLLLLVDLGMFLIAEDAFASFRLPDDYEQQMAQMYEEEQYGELDAFMDQYEIEPADYPVYTQITLLHNDYADFLSNSMECSEALSQGIIPDKYQINFVIKYTLELLYPDIPAYPDIYPENQPILNVWQEEALIYLSGVFGISSEELSALNPDGEPYYLLSTNSLSRLEESVIERWKEAGYHEADN
ncbi:MAG: zinc ribbon domain-containing protein [Clostridiales bacterium]|nr:zinc ribbon domain-containing protein [Clostridiales bacterium]